MPTLSTAHGFGLFTRVDIQGSGHGQQHRLTVQRSLYVIVEPVIDKPKLSILCPEALPFVGYGRTAHSSSVEVKSCHRC